jgi:hypothetical protein
MRRDFHSRCLPMTDVLLAELPQQPTKKLIERANFSWSRFSTANPCEPTQ